MKLKPDPRITRVRCNRHHSATAASPALTPAYRAFCDRMTPAVISAVNLLKDGPYEPACISPARLPHPPFGDMFQVAFGNTVQDGTIRHFQGGTFRSHIDNNALFFVVSPAQFLCNHTDTNIGYYPLLIARLVLTSFGRLTFFSVTR
jgi:hypothetical protein